MIGFGSTVVVADAGPYANGVAPTAPPDRGAHTSATDRGAPPDGRGAAAAARRVGAVRRRARTCGRRGGDRDPARAGRCSRYESVAAGTGADGRRRGNR